VGDVLASNENANPWGAFFASHLKLREPVFIPAGKGLYFNVGVTDTGGPLRSVLYTLL
jgi:hypothetical protein